MFNLSNQKPPSRPSGSSPGFGNGLVVYTLCAAVAAYIGWPLIKRALPDSFPMENHGGIEPYDAFGWRGDPGRVDRWKNADQGGPRSFSQYYPGPRTQRPERGYEVARRPGIEAGDYAAPMPRDTQGRSGCWVTVERRVVDPSFCERPGRR
jgi:hypothetical protein